MLYPLSYEDLRHASGTGHANPPQAMDDATAPRCLHPPVATEHRKGVAHTGFEPVIFSLRGRRAFQAAPMRQVERAYRMPDLNRHDLSGSQAGCQLPQCGAVVTGLEPAIS